MKMNKRKPSLSKTAIVRQRRRLGGWAKVAKYFGVRRSVLTQKAKRYGIDTSQHITPPKPSVLARLRGKAKRKIPLIKREPLVPVTKLPRSRLKGMKILWQLHVRAAFKEEKTGEITIRDGYSRTSHIKNVKTAFQEYADFQYTPDRPGSQWVLVKPGEKGYIPIEREWVLYASWGK